MVSSGSRFGSLPKKLSLCGSGFNIPSNALNEGNGENSLGSSCGQEDAMAVKETINMEDKNGNDNDDEMVSTFMPWQRMIQVDSESYNGGG